MDISIIIPVYNGEKTIEKCVSSLYKKTTSFSFEVIIIDDGSKDTTKELLESIEKKFPNIKIYHQENSGVSAARNVGLTKANGNKMVFLDADDYFDKEWGDILEKYIFAEEIMTVFLSYQIKANSEKNIISMILGHPGVPFIGGICSKIYNKNFIINNNIKFNTNVINGEDILFNLEVYEKSKSINFVEGKFYNYYIHEESATQNYNPKLIDSDLKFQEQVQLLLKDNKYKNYFSNFCILNAWLMFFRRYSFNSKFNYEEIKDLVNNKIYSDVILEYKTSKKLFSKSKRFILFLLAQRKYEMVFNLFKLKHSLIKRKKHIVRS